MENLWGLSSWGSSTIWQGDLTSLSNREVIRILEFSSFPTTETHTHKNHTFKKWFCYRNKRVNKWRHDTSLVCYVSLNHARTAACLPRLLRCFTAPSGRWYTEQGKGHFNALVGQSPAVPGGRERPRGSVPSSHQATSLSSRLLRAPGKREENHRARSFLWTSTTFSSKWFILSQVHARFPLPCSVNTWKWGNKPNPSLRPSGFSNHRSWLIANWPSVLQRAW